MQVGKTERPTCLKPPSATGSVPRWDVEHAQRQHQRVAPEVAVRERRFAEGVLQRGASARKRARKFPGVCSASASTKRSSLLNEWLVEHYEKNDRIFIFGFSRGAFTARSLAGFISKCGLLQAGSPLSINQLYGRYRKNEGSSILALQESGRGPFGNRGTMAQEVFARRSPSGFSGVWDTVGTLGVPLPLPCRMSAATISTSSKPICASTTRTVFHALAIDEHRDAFKPTLWLKTTHKNGGDPKPRPIDQVEQRWFVGAHSNVGGGYESDLLAHTPLFWIARKAMDHGLRLKATVDLDDDSVHCPVRDSLAEMVHGLVSRY